MFHRKFLSRISVVRSIHQQTLKKKRIQLIENNEKYISKNDHQISSNVIENISEMIKEDKRRLFAIIQLSGSQYKVTTDDLIAIDVNFFPTVNDTIRLEKVLLVGCNDFTLLGQPLLPRSLIKVEGKIIEKTLSHVNYWFNYTPRKKNRKLKLFQLPRTVLRITDISFVKNSLSDMDK
ncbi:hypothetical protein SNEBB_007291 [Seison nebaliae]|nr:hypothetical protein SNEBB_007291 [Seison nebaliae]